jgi:hypothetical protein
MFVKTEMSIQYGIKMAKLKLEQKEKSSHTIQ